MTIDHQRMTGVVTAIEAHHPIDLFGQPVDNLAFAFVTPLGADHDNILSHCFIPEKSNKNCNRTAFYKANPQPLYYGLVFLFFVVSKAFS